EIPDGELHGRRLDRIVRQVLQSERLKHVADPAAIPEGSGKVIPGIHRISLARTDEVSQVDGEGVERDRRADTVRKGHVELSEQRSIRAALPRAVVERDRGRSVIVERVYGNKIRPG